MRASLAADRASLLCSGEIFREATLKFYSFWRSLAAFRVRIALNLKGIVPDEVISVDLLKGEQRQDAYKQVNPQMLLPALGTATGRSCSSRSPSWNISTRRIRTRRSCREIRAAAPACARSRRSSRATRIR